MTGSVTSGRAIIDLAGLEATSEELGRLMHPCVAGVIFFARNYADPRQLRALVSQVRSRRPSLLLCVDHEGGRVQRFREGFTQVPPMGRIGELWNSDRVAALAAASAAGCVIATELSDCGIDFSFAPVLDLDHGASQIIGNRAFHRAAEAVGELAAAFITGLAEAGMGAVGKHFPGHGYVRADSHLAVPVDERSLEDILAEDVAPYRAAIRAGLTGIMPAHVVYQSVDPQPAGFSKLWLRDVLRSELGFDGLVFSDDLSMEGAAIAGAPPERARAALAAGCDLVLLCNDASAQEPLLEALRDELPPAPERTARMRLRPAAKPKSAERYREALTLLDKLR